MNKTTKLILLIIGILLLLIGLGNIWDDSRILVYDLTAIISGIGFIIISRTKWIIIFLMFVDVSHLSATGRSDTKLRIFVTID